MEFLRGIGKCRVEAHADRRRTMELCQDLLKSSDLAARIRIGKESFKASSCALRLEKKVWLHSKDLLIMNLSKKE